MIHAKDLVPCLPGDKHSGGVTAAVAMVITERFAGSCASSKPRALSPASTSTSSCQRIV